MVRRLYKHKLLLDENFPPRVKLPKLNRLYDLKHVAEDFHLSGITDKAVYKIAVEQKRLLLTFNYKDFRGMVSKYVEAGLIGVSANLTSAKIDTKVAALLAKNTVSSLYGAFHYVSGESRNA